MVYMSNFCINCNKKTVNAKAKRCWDCTVLYRKSRPSARSGECDFCHKNGTKNRAYKTEDSKRCCGNCYQKLIRGQREEFKQKRYEYNRLPEVTVAKKVSNDKNKEKNANKRNAKQKRKRKEDPVWRKRRNLETRIWFEENKDNPERKESYNSYFVNRQKTDINFRLASNLRKRLSAVVRGQKRGSAVRDLGCSVEKFRKHIESLFKRGMSWGNYGLHGWHLDHKIPLSIFDLSDRKQFLKACHYTNLQPLWAIDNIKKSNKIEE